jgi:hypothetical protein
MPRAPSPTPTEAQALEGLSQDDQREMGRVWSSLNAKQRDLIERKLSGKAVKQTELSPAVLYFMSLAAKAAVRRATVSKEDVIAGLLDAVDAAGTSADLTAAWREIGRVIGAYEPQRVEVISKVEDLTRERLLTMSTKDLIELTKRENGKFELEKEKDPHGHEFEALTKALSPPSPIRSDA